MAIRNALVHVLTACALTFACGGESSGDAEGGSGSGTGTGTDDTDGTDTGDTSGCAEGQSMCNGSCIDTQSNDNHCGACNNACGAMFDCYEGGCMHKCDGGGGEYCGGQCVYTEFNDEHCGECNNACGEGFSCQESVCEPQGDGDMDCENPSMSEPAGDPDGPYGSCTFPMDCSDANTCFSSCGGLCAPPCETADECPAIEGYTPSCLEDDFGDGTCQLGCAVASECPGGMACRFGICFWP